MKLTGIRQKVFLDRYSLKDKKGNPTEKTPEQMWKRVARGIASQEQKEVRAQWEKKFYDVLKDFKFVPGGRILSGAGTKYQVTYFNCFVIPSPKDSREGILESLKQLVEIQSRSGGVGLNLSSLRPRGARVKKVNGTSSGPVTWAGLFSYATHDVVQQGGCFAGDAKIMTHRGLVPIADIVASKSNYYANTHQGYKKVTTKFDNGVKDVYEVETRAGFRVKTTLAHKFVTFDKNGKFSLKPLADMQVGEHITYLLSEWGRDLPYAILNTNLATPSKYSYGLKDILLPLVLNEDLAFILGAYDADGSRIADEFSPNGKGIRIAVANDRPKDLQTLCDAITRCFGVVPKLRKGDGAVTIIQVFSRRLNEFLKLNGLLKKASVTVRAPEQIFTSPRKVVEAYIAGVFLGDGTNRGGKGGLRITTVSKPYAQELQLLLVNLGIPSKIKVQKRIEENWMTTYTVTVNGATFMKRFLTLLAPYTEKVLDHRISVREATFGWPFNMVERFLYVANFQRTQARTNVTTSQRSVMCLSQMTTVLREVDREDVALLGGCVADTISSITYIGKERVYDLEVEDAHLLSGNGFYTSNSRRGATMIMLWDWHPDVEEFITVKQDLSKINGANLSVCVSDAFMAAVKKDVDWDLVYPDLDDPRYDEKWNGEIDEWKKMGGKIKVYKTIKARELWDLICTAAWCSAEPGLHFLERSNKRSNTHYFEKLLATNPSLRAETRVLTKEGIFPIETLEGKKFLVKNLDGKWSNAECFLSGKDKELYKITLGNGSVVYATPEHKWPVLAVGGGFGKITTDKLQAGNILPFPKAENIEFDTVSPLTREEGFMVGWLYGDGWISIRGTKNAPLEVPMPLRTPFVGPKNVRNFSLQSQLITTSSVSQGIHQKHEVKTPFITKEEWVFGFLFSEEDKVLVDGVLREVNKLKKVKSTLTRAGDNTYTIQSTSSEFAENLSRIFKVRKKEHGLPESIWRSGNEFIKGFVDGLISSDGFIAKSSNRITLTTKHKKVAEDISSLLSFYGIKSHIRRSESGIVKFPNGKNYYKTYERYDVSIEGYHAVNFGKIFTLSHPRKQANLKRIMDEYKQSRALPDEGLIRIRSVEKTDIKENVWDISVYDDTHSFYINHCVTGNCGEQPLGAWAVCNLGAMNLAAYVKGATTDKAGEFDYDSFGRDVRVAMRFLDNVIDETYYFFPQNEQCAKDIRRTGLGIMGIADALIKMKLRYGAKESLAVIKKIFQTLRNSAYGASSDLAAEKGAFPMFDKEKYLQGYHVKQLPKKLQAKIATLGIRNAVLLTIAPTGTTSLLSGVSSGIEPVYEFAFIRRDRTGEHTLYHPLFEAWKKKHPSTGSGQVQKKPGYFVSANDLTPLEHAKVQAIAQEYIDSSISKTVNAPNAHTVEDVKTLYMAAYDMGLKGVTYMRDGSREGVLSRIEPSAGHSTVSSDRIGSVQEKPAVVDQPVAPRPMQLAGMTYQVDTPVGKTYITINHDERQEPFEVFITIGKSGSDVAAMADALGRMISTNLRLSGGLSPRERMRQIVAQLSGIGGARSIGFGKERVRSLPDAVAKVLAMHFAFAVNGMVIDRKPANGNGHTASTNTPTLGNGQNADAPKPNIVMIEQLPLGSPSHAGTNLFDICPECGGGTLAFEEGCKKCYSCGYSEC